MTLQPHPRERHCNFPQSVVHVQWNGASGGVGRLVHDLAVEQAGRGLAVSVAFAQATGPFTRAARQSDVRVLDLGLRSGYDLHPPRIRAAIAQLSGADVVHVHALNVPLSLVVQRAVARRLVVTEHGALGLGRDAGLADALKRRIVRRLLARPDTSIAANSTHTATRMCEVYGLDRRCVRVVYNGVRFGALRGPLARPPSPGLNAVFVGRLVSFKRVDRLLRGAACARARDRIRVRIVGSGPLEQPLRELAVQLGLEDVVSFLGHRDDVDALLDTCDVLVHPSQHEPFGLAIVEACGRGLIPVVFGDAGGALEVLPPDGRVVQSHEELGRVLDELITSAALEPPARRDRAAWARRTFPLGRMADAYDTIYRAGRHDVGTSSAAGAPGDEARIG